MEISINVNEDKFKEVLKSELDAFTKEELHEICRDGLVKCMSSPEMIAELFNCEDTQWNYSRTTPTPSDILKAAAKDINLSPAFDDLQKKALDYIHDNGDKMIIQILAEIFTQSISNYFFNNEQFKQNFLSTMIHYSRQ